MSVPAGEGSQKRRKGCLAGTFLSFISRFFLYLNLQICIIQGQPIKEEYNGGRWESEVCVGKVAAVGPFHLPGMAIPVCDTRIRDLEAGGPRVQSRSQLLLSEAILDYKENLSPFTNLKISLGGVPQTYHVAIRGSPELITP